MENKSEMEFTKDDLMAGMVVLCRDGVLKAVVPSSDGLFLVADNGDYTSLQSLDNDMSFMNSGLDIMKVYGFGKYANTTLSTNIDGRKVLWERKSPWKFTVKELKAQLEKKYNVDIVIIDEDRKGKIFIGDNVFTDADKAIIYLNKIKKLKSFMKPFDKPKYKVGDRFFFDDLSTFERKTNNGLTVIKRMRFPLKNVEGKVSGIDEGNEITEVKYRIQIDGHEETDIGVLLFDEYILDNYGKKINC